MTRKETCVQKNVCLTAKRFPSITYAAGVNVEEVVRFVLAKRNAIESIRLKKNNPGDDERDISYASWLLRSLSSKALETICKLKPRELRDQLKDHRYPFSSLKNETREKLSHIPISWITKGAQRRLNPRKSPLLQY